jgi:hypothetical protein
MGVLPGQRNFSMCLRHFILLVSLLVVAPAARCELAADPSSSLSEASSLSLEGAVALADGVLTGGSYVLVALEPLGEGALAVFSAVGGSAKITLELSGDLVAFAGKRIGEVVELVAMAGGSALMLSGEIIAFVPDQLSRSMHHRRRLTP